ncbi:MAG: hypothetical protein K8T89_05760 [Planctomycetes bacterium]|nr:hypothetical protein [Planctomycetota bacterium]
MPTPNSNLEANSELADRINAEALANPESPYSGKFIGIANGQVVIISEDMEEVCEALEKIESDPTRTFIVEGGVDDSVVDYIWESA